MLFRSLAGPYSLSRHPGGLPIREEQTDISRTFRRTISLYCCYYIEWVLHASKQQCSILMLLIQLIHINFIDEHPNSRLLRHGHPKPPSSLVPSLQWPTPPIQKSTGYPYPNSQGRTQETQATPCHCKSTWTARATGTRTHEHVSDEKLCDSNKS